MRRSALAAVVAIGLFGLAMAEAPDASANGRPPSASTINFRRGNEQQIVAGLTFGAVISMDGGATWQWSCEDNFQYSGVYDPHYVWTAGGLLFATSFHGLRVSSDNGCNMGLSAIAQDDPPHSMSLVTLAPNGDIYSAGTDAVDGKIYRSTDGGMTFPQTAMPGMPKDWWQSLVVAPSDSTRVYLSGYRMAGTRQFLLFKSIDSGVTFTATGTDFSTIRTVPASNIDIFGVDPGNEEIVYMRVTVVNNNIGDDLYRSVDGGKTWGLQPILSKGDSLHAIVRSNGDLVVGSQTLGAWVSHDKGDTWTDLVNPPHLSCLAENAAHEVWGCSLNFGSNQIPPDGYGIMKTTDLATWTGVLRFQDIVAPYSCDASSIQESVCVANLWCGVRNQLGITENPTGCVDPSADVPIVAKPPGGGCCSVGSDGAPVWICLAVVVGVVLIRPRNRRRRRR